MYLKLLWWWTQFWTKYWEASYAGPNKNKLPKIVIKTVPHSRQRYNTVGDYYYTIWGTRLILVSKMGDWRNEIPVAIHELIETTLCRNDGVTDEDVDRFDLEHDQNRAPGDASEPGDDPNAPYHSQHVYATKVEAEVCKKLGLDWEVYDVGIQQLMK